MPRIRFILSKQSDPALEEAAIIKRLKEFHSRLQEKRQISDGIPQEERAAYNELWHYPQNELPKSLEIRIRRWAQKIHRHHLKEVEPTRLSREDRVMLEGCRDGAEIFDLRSAHHIDEVAAALHAEFPWVSEATTHVWRSLHHHRASGRPGAQFAPVLLDGPPGIGKSAWARRLAQLLDTPDMTLDATGENASFGLVGSQRGWSNAGPGRLVGLMLMRQVANPLVIIDEIEKSGTPKSDKGRAFSLPNALLPLLEELTASRWTCPYFQKRVRRWVVVAIDVATRMILGCAFCSAPNQEASLECLRMCFVDKTPLLREAGLFESSWDNRAPIHMVSTDSGSEFGKNPFGGSRFVEAVRILSGSLLNAVTGVAELRAHIERLFRTFELKWARHLPGWTAGAPHLRNDRNPGREACLTDDDLHRLFVTFVADYNASPDRGLGGATPSGIWAKLSKHEQFDPFALPGSQALREACGSSHSAGVSEAGIRFEGLVYSNEFIRNQRKAPGVDRIAQSGEKLEIIVDPMNLGAISVVANGDLISVPCLDETMRGKSLTWWKAEKTRRKAEAALDVADHSKAQSEARESWRGEAKAIADSAGVTMEGRSDEEAARLRKELEFGKGAHEKPFVGRDEFIDPLQTGFAIGSSGSHTASAPTPSSETEAAEHPDGANPLDRFRSNGARRRPRS